MRLLLGAGGHRTEERKRAWVDEMRDFLGPDIRKVLFIPFAQKDHEKHVKLLCDLGFNAGYELDSLHRYVGKTDLDEVIDRAEAVFIGGGNTFRLAHQMQKFGLYRRLQRAFHAKQVPYIGISAGTNLACPGIFTTNDMPIVMPQSFNGLGLIPFQINTHYLDKDPASKHLGETREERIAEFHEVCDLPVLGLREGTILRIEGNLACLIGASGAKLFRNDKEPEELTPESLGNLMLGL